MLRFSYTFDGDGGLSSQEGTVGTIFSELSQRLASAEPPYAEWAKPSAVMMLIARLPEPAVLLIRRPDTLTHHAGQIACPGGSLDPGMDQCLWDAAQREAEEEVGIRVAPEAVAGFLDPIHIHVTGFTLLPVVAVVDRRPPVVPLADEVAEYRWVNLDTLRRIRRTAPMDINGGRYQMAEFPLEWGRLWGATARAVDQLLHVLEGDIV